MQRKFARIKSADGGGNGRLETKSVIPWPPGSLGQTTPRLVKPIDILHAIGLVTTPPITELVDLSSTWAEIRYLWAFRPVFGAQRFGARSLRMNAVVKDLDFHQKTLLSDELGVGFGCYFMLQVVGAVDPIDAYVAMRQGQFGLRGARRRGIPDYIFTASDGSGYFVVERKGTQSGRATVINQLRRGTEQVQAVDIDPPASVRRLVVGASLKDAIAVYVIDPPDGDFDGDGSEGVPIDPLVRWSPSDIPVFAAAKRLTYIGDNLAASKTIAGLVEPRFAIEGAQRPIERHETELGRFVGTVDGRRTPDGRTLTIFRGLSEEIYKRDVSGDRQPDETRRVDTSIGGRAFKTSTTAEGATTSVRSLSPDGTLLDIRIE